MERSSARVIFYRHNFLNFRALDDRSGRTEQLWAMIRAWFWPENVCVHARAWSARLDQTNGERPSIFVFKLDTDLLYEKGS